LRDECQRAYIEVVLCRHLLRIEAEGVPFTALPWRMPFEQFLLTVGPSKTIGRHAGRASAISQARPSCRIWYLSTGRANMQDENSEQPLVET
jgi:hypothetical protein